MKIYIAGKIAGDRRYRAKFREAAKALEGPEEAPHKGTCWACRRKRKVVNRFAVEEVQG